MHTLRSRAGSGKIVAIALAAMAAGATVIWFALFSPKPGVVELVGAQALKIDGKAVARLQVRFVEQPRGGHPEQVVLNTYSPVFQHTEPTSLNWEAMANGDDNPATDAALAPPLGEVVTIDVPIHRWVDYNRTASGETYNVDLALSWADDQVLWHQVDITEAIGDGGQVTINNATISGGDSTPVVIDLTFTVDYVPAEGDLTDLNVVASSFAMESDYTMSWNDIALRDDSPASVPGQAPPTGVPMTIRLHVNDSFRSSITTYNSQQVAVTLGVDWLGRRRDHTTVDASYIYQF